MANLTTLLDWMQWLEDIQAHIQKVKETPEKTEQSHCCIHIDKFEDDGSRDKRADAMIHALKYYQKRMEEELRKPGKSWNYPPN